MFIKLRTLNAEASARADHVVNAPLVGSFVGRNPKPETRKCAVVSDQDTQERAFGFLPLAGQARTLAQPEGSIDCCLCIYTLQNDVVPVPYIR
jgi:hypothetical protein